MNLDRLIYLCKENGEIGVWLDCLAPLDLGF